jgi:hypothetical protein
VSANGSSFDTIIVGNGDGDGVNANDSNDDTIILGNGERDSVNAGTSYVTARIRAPTFPTFDSPPAATSCNRNKIISSV